MIERYEIQKAIADRSRNMDSLTERVAMERDFRGADWFTSHPACDPVNEIYYYDFQEKRLKIHK